MLIKFGLNLSSPGHMILVALSREWIAYRQVAQPKIIGEFHRRDKTSLYSFLKGDISPTGIIFKYPQSRRYGSRMGSVETQHCIARK